MMVLVPMVHKFTVEFPEKIWKAIQENKGSRSIKEFLINLIEKELKFRKVKAFILAGGEGARLKPLTEAIPKAMIPVGYKPLLEYNLELLSKNGITDVVLLIGRLGNKIMQYFGQHWNDVRISYVSETRKLDTAGALQNAQNLFSDTFIVMNSDILTNMRIAEAIEFHNKHKDECIATICGLKVPDYYKIVGKSDEKGLYADYGVFYIDDEKTRNVIKFEETPSKAQRIGYINTGIYIFEPSITEYLDNSEGKSISGDIIPKLIRDKQIKAYVSPSSVFWIDVAHPERWSKAWEVLFSGAIEF